MRFWQLLVPALLAATGCIQEGDSGNCAGPGPGDPNSGVDLRIVEETLTAGIEGGNAVIRVTYFNAGNQPAVLAEGAEDILMALYLDRSDCPPSGEDSDYLLGLPKQIPPSATAEVGISIPVSELAPGGHNVFARVDPTNATWEADEFNNCDGPVDFDVP